MKKFFKCLVIVLMLGGIFGMTSVVYAAPPGGTTTPDTGPQAPPPRPL